jgi:hypothetical protein
LIDNKGKKSQSKQIPNLIVNYRGFQEKHSRIGQLAASEKVDTQAGVPMMAVVNFSSRFLIG